MFIKSQCSPEYQTECLSHIFHHSVVDGLLTEGTSEFLLLLILESCYYLTSLFFLLQPLWTIFVSGSWILYRTLGAKIG